VTAPTEVTAIAAADGTVYDAALQAVGFTRPLDAKGQAVPASAVAPPTALVAEERDRAAELTRQLVGAVRDYSNNRPRSQQRRIGPSEVGGPCTRRLGYKLAGVEPVNRSGGDPWAAFVGTATHAELEQVFQAIEGWATEVRITVDSDLELAGSCDLIRLTGGVTVIDHKVVGAATMKKARSSGPSDTYRVQANLYAHGLIASGVPVEWTAIAFWPRSGRLADLYVWLQRYDQAAADRGLTRLATLRQLVAVGGRQVLGQLPVAEHYCDSCDFYRPGSDDPAVACGGAR
jgi:hypothetical protein